MWVEELIAKCPRFSKVVIYVETGVAAAYRYADPGDVIQLFEYRGEKLTGRSITALVLRGAENQDGLRAEKSGPPTRLDRAPSE